MKLTLGCATRGLTKGVGDDFLLGNGTNTVTLMLFPYFC